MMDATALIEQSKYARMWAKPEYRVWSPGEDSVPEALVAFGGAGSLIDFGCGDGKALAIFQAAGFAVRGVDIVGLRPDVTVACLWDLPVEFGAAEYGFCADVMEHIPPGKVAAVLAGIAARVTHRCFFRISTVPDSMGALIGEPLHLTVQPAAWWIEQVGQHMTVHSAEARPDHVVIVGKA